MSIFETAVGICQLTLAEVQRRQQAPLTREQIATQAAEILAMPTFKSEVELDELVKRLEIIFTIWSNDPRALDGDDGHVPWLSARRGEIDWKFWNRYKLFIMHEQKLAPAAVTNVEKVVDEVLSRLEDPNRPGPWDRRGLVMGNVQSGKTGAYAGLICKAADAGYKVLIILAGLHNNLRSQTQVRLDEGFLGYKAVPPSRASGGFTPVGVHRYGANVRADSVTNRDDNGDFKSEIARHFAIHPGGNPLLFVVKKNVTILRNLLAWIDHSADATDPETGRKYHLSTPVLIIDDESDQASIDTRPIPFDEDGNPDPEHDPTETNKLIRSLLHSFDKSAYVGFTATPFANIFIHEKAKTAEHGEDLFPRSFILNLPAPSNYIGAVRMFGVMEDAEAGLEEVKPLPVIKRVSDHASSLKPRETQGWMPPRPLLKTEHVPLIDGERGIPDSLRKAIMCFMLSSAVRAVREPPPIINSMLVHVVRFTKVQGIVREEIEEALREIVNRLEFGDGNRKPTVLEQFSALWEDDYVPTSQACGEEHVLPPFGEVARVLFKVAASVVVKSINGSALDTLNYEEHRSTGLNVIAVGGDKLSRGLTLDGLTVSYFLRASRMYDTLMQMGRWFGYKESYIDVCRLFTTEELEEWFRHIAASTEELKQEFDYMVSIGATPREYGLRVRSHPVMLVTSQVKMRNGTEMRLSYAGDISETVVFDLQKAQWNLKAARQLLDGLGASHHGKLEGGYTWRSVGSEPILQFLKQYDAAGAPRANPTLWCQYIRRQNEQGELTTWTVHLASSGLARTEEKRLDRFFGGMRIGAIEREPSESPEGRHAISRLVSPSDEGLDLSEGELGHALNRTRELWSKDTRKNRSPTPPKQPSGRGIRFARSKVCGLLLLYPLERGAVYGDAGLDDEVVPLVGVAISFPSSDTAKDISYVVTNRYAEDADLGDF